MMRAALMLVATAGSPICRHVVKGPVGLNQFSRQFAHEVGKLPFPSRLNYSFTSSEFSAVLMRASEVDEGACSFTEQVHLERAIHRALNFFAADDLGMRPIDLLRVVLNCRGLPHGSIVMALNTARQSYETAKHFKEFYKDEKYAAMEEMYQGMIEELEVSARTRIAYIVEEMKILESADRTEVENLERLRKAKERLERACCAEQTAPQPLELLPE